jgi:hypothetical protein
MQRFTFNRPITLLFSVPLLLLIFMFGYGLSVEFRLSLVFMLLLSATVVGLLFYLGMLRRMEIGADKAIWTTPNKRFEMAMADVKHFGIVKFRSFRFIYLSRSVENPFGNPNNPVVTDENTFMVQFRPAAWNAIEAAIVAIHPNLKPSSLTRQ